MADYGWEHVRSYMRSLATYLGATLPIYESMYTYMLRNLRNQSRENQQRMRSV